MGNFILDQMLYQFYLYLNTVINLAYRQFKLITILKIELIFYLKESNYLYLEARYFIIHITK